MSQRNPWQYLEISERVSCIAVTASGIDYIFNKVSVQGLILALSFKVWDVYFGDDPLLLIGLIFGNCLLWLFSGLLMKLVYFSISGILGLLLIIGYFIIN